MKTKINIALAGNPNSGKTTLFNALTGARQHVGNYPGVTVEKKEGQCIRNGHTITITDLPGTYSMTAYSMEEVVARDFIIDEKPDVIVDVVDASNLERNLYLAVQLMELNVPLVLAFNMIDVAKARGLKFDLEELSFLLGVPIVPTVGSKGEGLDELMEAAIAAAESGRVPSVKPNYGAEMEAELARIQAAIEQHGNLPGRYTSRWGALKLLENDGDIREKVGSPEVLEQVEASTALIERRLGDHPEILMADHRYGFISGACQESVLSTVETRHDMSDRIDAVVTNRVLGFPVFFGLMYLVFHLTFTLGALPMDWIEAGFGWLGGAVSGLWAEGSESPLRSLLVDGVIGGVGGVIIFLPNILILFLAIAILDASGYMARVAFIMDRLMHKIGLHGKSFIPMLIGFGCSIPAIMATRTLDNRRDRLATMLVIPLMSCGARFPIYALIIPAFFPEAWRAPMLWTIYMIGITLAITGAKVLKSTVFKGDSPPFVMELPPYRLPTLRGVMIHMWERAWLYLKKAGTVILVISIILWAMTTYPKMPEADGAAQSEEVRQADELAYSLAGRIGHAMEPVISPMGFDWKIGTALIGALAAKEVFVAQLGIVYSMGETDEESVELREQLRRDYSPLVGFCIMLFCLISAPCMATTAIVRRESNSWGWALGQLVGLTVLAYVLTVMVYQVGSLLGLGV